MTEEIYLSAQKSVEEQCRIPNIIKYFRRSPSKGTAWRDSTTEYADCMTQSYTHTTGSKLRCQTPIKHTRNISELLRISVKYSSIFTDDGSHTIRNMSE